MRYKARGLRYDFYAIKYSRRTGEWQEIDDRQKKGRIAIEGLGSYCICYMVNRLMPRARTTEVTVCLSGMDQ